VSFTKQAPNVGAVAVQAGNGAEPPTPVAPAPVVPLLPPPVPPLAQFPAPLEAPHSPRKPPLPALPAVPASFEVFKLAEHAASNATAGTDRSAERIPRSKCRTGRIPEAITAVFVRM
jgi:hypothetical protein